MNTQSIQHRTKERINRIQALYKSGKLTRQQANAQITAALELLVAG